MKLTFSLLFVSILSFCSVQGFVPSTPLQVPSSFLSSTLASSRRKGLDGPNYHTCLKRNHFHSLSAGTNSVSKGKGLTLYAGGEAEDLDIRDRLGSALVYLLPVLDGINYGHFLFSYFPEVSRPVFSLINPILSVYKSNAFIPLFCYLALIYVGRNSNLPRFTRFNIQQAVVLDVAIVLPSIILALLENAPLYVQEPISNLFFFCLVASVGYAWVSIARGIRPTEIPIISQAADMSVGPF